MFGSKKEEFTLEKLRGILESKIDALGDVELFECTDNSIELLRSNKVGNKYRITVSKNKKKYIIVQEMTGKQPLFSDSKNLLDFAEWFPIEPETKKSLSKRFY